MIEIGRVLRPNAERLERVLRNEAAVLAHDHDGGDGRSLGGISFHRRLNFDPRVFTDCPLAVAAARTTSRTASLQSGDDSMLVAR